MPSCCVGCKVKGRLFRFPTNVERRNQWLSNCSSFTKENWKYSQNAKLCENHFDENQFEQNRLDLKKKLKPCAVPTIFVKNHKKKTTSKVKAKGKLKCKEEIIDNSSEVEMLLSEDILEDGELCYLDEEELLEPMILKGIQNEKRALKARAVPKLFKKKRNVKKKLSKMAKSKDSSVNEEEELEISSEIETVLPEENLDKDETNMEQCGQLIISNGYSQITLDCDIVFNENSNENNQTKNIESTSKKETDLNELLPSDATTESAKKEESSFEREMRYMCNMKQLENENKKLTKMMQCLEKFLHKEQMELLMKQESNEKVHKWSKECILTCLKLKSVLGWDGYRHLLSMGYPGPSQSTLGKYLQQYYGEMLKDLSDS